MRRRLLALPGGPSRRRSLLLLVVVLLAGVLGMHALSLHSRSDEGIAQQAIPLVPGLDGVPGHHELAGDVGAGQPGSATSAGDEDHGHGIAELCLAVLLALSILSILGAVLRRPASAARLRDLLPRRVDPPSRRPRARGPSLATLCLLRC